MSGNGDRVSEKFEALVKEELKLAKKVTGHLLALTHKAESRVDYASDMIELRDAIKESALEDIPPLVEQLTRLSALSNQRGKSASIPLDPGNPYFGHLLIYENKKSKDILLGKSTYLDSKLDVSVVDWRNAPVSRIYYSSEPGDEYEEEFGGRIHTGIVNAKRAITFSQGLLRQINCKEGTFIVSEDDSWKRLTSSNELRGGQGKSTRADKIEPVRNLGTDIDGIYKEDKHLPEIAALLDKKQFELITRPDTGPLYISGSAGSGKTTVALHRIAFLVFNNPNRFRTGKIMVFVFNKGLARYVSKVLPALGVHGVQVMTLAKWSASLCRKYFKNLPVLHAGDTPESVKKAKRHPALLRILDDLVDVEDVKLTAKLKERMESVADGYIICDMWRKFFRIPLDARCKRILGILNNKRNNPGNKPEIKAGTLAVAEAFFRRIESETKDVVMTWAEFFTDFDAMKQAFDTHAPLEFSESELREVHSWCKEQYNQICEDSTGFEATLDYDDNVILLRLYQLKRGWLVDNQRRIFFDHLMLDEVQDFSPVEIAVLLDLLDREKTITMAGDESQKIHSGEKISPDELLAELGLKKAMCATLEVAYRSTREIMHVGAKILGSQAEKLHSVPRSGAQVEFFTFSAPGQAVGFLADALRSLVTREPFANTVIVARYPSQAKMYYDGLNIAEIPRLELVTDGDFSFSPGIEVTDANNVKGLEFDYVILVDVNHDSYPDKMDARRILYMSATRAAHQLWMISTGKPSPLIHGFIEGENNYD